MGQILTMGHNNEMLKASVLIEGNETTRIGNVKGPSDLVIDAKNRFAMPRMTCAHSLCMAHLDGECHCKRK